ncbi:NfeD family protein [Wielerella bovis]|uniref:NfeD family protein n=1 Tax=Wielerella bovis TaxID=2917790 RepID=UPI002018BDD5|nr:NfeD family protein [Wielerella bovis]ULJ64523.1 NfeD family protein [Wielerella bovis]ULJ66812.1 NfeD family protein [Wielerella bovis]ULJ69035.1 NfeD family protein [Wielerella bovis]
MALWTFWLILACLVFVAEMFTGTFYLLVLAVALCGAGIFTLLFDVSMQMGLLIVAFLSLVGTIYVYQTRRQRPMNNDDLDIGSMVQVEQPLSGGMWRVFYRGATWEARAVDNSHFQMGDTARICGKDGIVLLIENDV